MPSADNLLAGGQHHAEPLAAALGKASPPLAYLGATFAGLSLPDWAALLAIVYTLGLLAQMAYRFGGFLWDKWIRRSGP